MLEFTFITSTSISPNLASLEIDITGLTIILSFTLLDIFPFTKVIVISLPLKVLITSVATLFNETTVSVVFQDISLGNLNLKLAPLVVLIAFADTSLSSNSAPTA